MTSNNTTVLVSGDGAGRAFLRAATKRRESSVIFALIIMIIIMSASSPYFLTEQNLFNVLRNMSSIMVIAIGMTMVIITGGIDLSVGSTLGVTAMLAARMMTVTANNLVLTGYSPITGIFCAFLLGTFLGFLIGFLIGVIITKLDVNPFIATLGMLSIGRGLSYLFSTGVKGSVAANIPIKNAFVQFIGMGRVNVLGLGIPMQVIIMLLLVIVFSLFLKYTVLGRQIYAVGANAEAAKLSGVNVDAVKIFVYSLTGMLCALSGLMTAGLVAAAVTNAGSGAELDVIAAVVIGGASLSGGEGTILGAVIGAAIMAILKNAFVLLHLPIYMQTISIGVVIVLAVALDGWRRRRATR